MRGLLMLLPVVVSVLVPAAATEDRSAVLRGIESNLLSLFGFSRRPRPDRHKVVPAVPADMLRLYREHTGRDPLTLDTTALALPGKHTASANTVRSFTHEASPIDEQFPTPHVFRLAFDLSKIPSEEKLKAAELQLQVGAPPHQGRLRVLVEDIVRPGIAGARPRDPILRLVDSVETSGSDPLTLDVLPAVQRWLHSPADNHGLLVRVSSTDDNGDPPSPTHVRLKRSAGEDAIAWHSRQPLLFAYTDDGKHKYRHMDDIVNRSKRGASRKTKRKDGRENCRRHRMYVDFSDVGWNDWIVAPPGYDAYYCQGDCPFPLADHLNSTNHAIVQTLVNSVNPGAVPKACCVPTQLTTMSMLYLDEENKVVLKNYQDMTVSGCGCR